MQPERHAKTPLWALGAVGALGVGLQMPKSLPLALAGFVLVVGFLYLREPDTLRMIGNWRFWIAGFAIAALSGLLLGKRATYLDGVPVSLDGLTTGVIIVLRAGILVSLLMAFSKRISPDWLVRQFARMGAPQAGGAFALGVKLLPRMVADWKNSLSTKRHRGWTARMAALIKSAMDLADEISRDMDVWMKPRKPAKLFILSGSKGSGKTGLARTLAEELQTSGLAVRGFLQPALRDGKNESGYDLELLPGHQRLDLARPSDTPGEPWRFSREAFDSARRHLEADEKTDIYIIDEVGRLERAGGGHWPALARRMPEGGGVWLLLVRDGLQETVAARLGYAIEAALHLPADDDARQSFLADVKNAIEDGA